MMLGRLFSARKLRSLNFRAMSTSNQDIELPPGFERVGNVNDLKEGMSTFDSPTNNTKILLVKWKDQFHAMSALCPHKKAELVLGDIEEFSTTSSCGKPYGNGFVSVKCPKHRKKYPGGLNFNVATGENWVGNHTGTQIPLPDSKYDPTWCLPVYKTMVINGTLFVSTTPEEREAPSCGAEGTQLEIRDDSPEYMENGGHMWYKAKVHEIVQNTLEDAVHSVFTYTLELPPSAPVLSEKEYSSFSSSVSAWHVALSLVPPNGTGNGQKIDVIRDYTPISTLEEYYPRYHGKNEAGRVRILIKIYSLGAFTSQLLSLKESDTLWVTAPEMTLNAPYLLTSQPEEMASSVAIDNAQDRAIQKLPFGNIVLIAGGTGIAPMYQLLRHLLLTHDISLSPDESANPEGRDVQEIFLFTSNHTPQDTLLLKELSELASISNGRLHINHSITRSNDELGSLRGEELASLLNTKLGLQPQYPQVSYSLGRITEDVIRDFISTSLNRKYGHSQPDASVSRSIISGPRGMFDDMKNAVLMADIIHPQHHEFVELEA